MHTKETKIIHLKGRFPFWHTYFALNGELIFFGGNVADALTFRILTALKTCDSFQWFLIYWINSFNTIKAFLNSSPQTLVHLYLVRIAVQIVKGLRSGKSGEQFLKYSTKQLRLGTLGYNHICAAALW